MASTESHDDEYQAAWQECILNDRPIDWGFWVQKMPTLSALQASALMHGLDPGIHRDFTKVEADVDVKKAMAEAVRLQALAQALHVEHLSPAEWLNWADSQKWIVHALYRIEIQKIGAMRSASNSTQSGSPATHKEKPTPDWIIEAQKRAKAYIKQQRAKDLFPSQSDIADRIAMEFRRESIFGPQGKPICGATIKRHALTGISTEQDKLTAIGKQWGKRSKK